MLQQNPDGGDMVREAARETPHAGQVQRRIPVPVLHIWFPARLQHISQILRWRRPWQHCGWQSDHRSPPARSG